MEGITGKENRVLKQIGGALFGAFLSSGVSESIRSGAGFVYTQEWEQWGAAFWGSHHIWKIRDTSHFAQRLAEEPKMRIKYK